MGIVSTAFRDTYTLAFQVSPIIFVGGIAKGVPGNMLPFVATIGELAGLAQGLLSGGLGMSAFPIQFVPVPGQQAISQTAATYPFANQHVAANAVVQQPKSVSLRMIAPVRDTGGYLTKLALFSSIQTTFERHNDMGGWYTVATPSLICDDLLMLDMTDITGGDTKQQQVEWQINFTQPLITAEKARYAYSNLMAKMKGGQKTAGNWSGISAATASAQNFLNQGIGAL
jgi:hypothetical protein